MGSIMGEEVIDGDNQESSAQGEKIFVAIRLRPLNERELSKNDVSEWDCINNTTIIFKNSLQERSLLPTGYTFDRVFGYDASTRQVYDEAAKKIALSALSGINSTIFAYGQTSSGKTYTMSGVTEYAVTDIYDYISKHDERRFMLRFSAIEIYNESVRDLLCADNITTLRLLDDPERGTVIDKLTEVSLKDANHLKELLSICEAQRQIGETTLNEMSSRSHQILRLTIESETRHYTGALNASSLTASVNFVDLAGSERASQTLSAGTRLKEGCHINRSLLTLGTVIRKLGKGRNAHIPYRDSKLTRILQNSLGGNARTAIICTMSPAHSHVEQSRNTLLFASCAKQVSTNASVNVVMSEKALVKQLQRELARLENELRNLRSLSAVSAEQSALQEKELLIEKMNKEMQDLINQRDFAQSRVEDMIRHTPSKSWDMMHHHGSWTDEYSPSEASDIIDPLRFDVASAISSGTPHSRYERALSSRIEDHFAENNDEQFLSDDTSPRLYIDKYFGPDPCKGWEKITQETSENVEDNIKEVQCIEIDFTRTNVISEPPSPPEMAANSGQSLCLSDNGSSSPRTSVERSKSCEAILTTLTENKNTMQNEAVNCGEFSQVEGLAVANNENLLTEGSLADSMNDEDGKEKLDEPRVKNLIHLFEPRPVNIVENDSVRYSSVQEEASMQELDEVIVYKAVKQAVCDSETISTKKEEAGVKEPNEMVEAQMVKELNEGILPKSIEELDEIIKSKTEKITAEHDLDMEERAADKSEETTVVTPQDTKNSASDWQIEFERQKREIIELWDACHIPLVHRTCFFLLFQGDPSDAVYMEVELRRLSFLKNTLHGVVKDDQLFKQASSTKALNREREILSRRMLKKYSAKERVALFKKWGICVKSKQRRLQLCRMLWCDTKNMEHINDSASIVAKLVGFIETGQAPKEMFGLSFSPKPTNFRSFSWRHSLPSVM